MLRAEEQVYKRDLRKATVAVRRFKVEVEDHAGSGS